MNLKKFSTLLTLTLAISIGQISHAATPPNLDDRADCKRYIDETFAETVALLSQEELPPAPNYDMLKLAVEKYYDGTNEIILDDVGYPSIMYRFDKFKDINGRFYPAFIIENKVYPQVYIGKYESIVFHGRAYSLPNVDPTTSIGMDDARKVTIDKGRGWHVTSNVEYTIIARYCRLNDFYPHGNTNTDENENFYPGETGRITLEKRNENGKLLIRRMATGSGPVTWSHTGDVNGIYDFNGNVWEYGDGFRLENGEIQVIKDNDVVLQKNWNKWKAINKHGKLVKPGAKNTWKLDSTKSDNLATFHEISDARPFLSLTRKKLMYSGGDVNNDYGFASCRFTDLKLERNIPEILKMHSVYPPKAIDPNAVDEVWVRNYGTRRIMRGGMWARSTGVFGSSLAGAWNDASPGMGFRISYIDLE